MDDRHNPYAPPVESTAIPEEHPATPTGSLRLSDQGWDIVTSLARWMRVVGASECIVAALLVALGCVLAGLLDLEIGLKGVRSGWLVLGALFLIALFLAGGGMLLRQAARRFYSGVLSGAERPLAVGFRKLRIYLILYGGYSVFGLITQIYRLVLRGGS